MSAHLEKLSNGELWEAYKAAMDAWGADLSDVAKMRAVDQIEDEFIRRMRIVKREAMKVAHG